MRPARYRPRWTVLCVEDNPADLLLARCSDLQLISARDGRSGIERGLEAGFFRYLAQPIKLAEFMHALDQALGSADLRNNHSKETT